MIKTTNHIKNIAIIGAGNIAWHLSHEFTKAGLKITRIINRSASSARMLSETIGTQYTTDFKSSNEDSDVIIIAVSDSYLDQVINQINISNKIVLHTSGSMEMNIFSGKSNRFGVFYPFQSLTKNVETDFSEIPILTEASDEVTHNLIDNLASRISTKVFRINSDHRIKLHLAGAIANNFTNHLIARTFDYMEKNKLERNLIMPLIRETFKRIEKTLPKEAQTGPARRFDQDVIERHLKMLDDDPELKYLYNAISDSIIAYYF